MLAADSGYKLPDLAEPSDDAYMKAVVVLLLPYLLSHRSRLATLSGKSFSQPCSLHAHHLTDSIEMHISLCEGALGPNICDLLFIVFLPPSCR